MKTYQEPRKPKEQVERWLQSIEVKGLSRFSQFGPRAYPYLVDVYRNMIEFMKANKLPKMSTKTFRKIMEEQGFEVVGRRDYKINLCWKLNDQRVMEKIENLPRMPLDTIARNLPLFVDVYDLHREHCIRRGKIPYNAFAFSDMMKASSHDFTMNKGRRYYVDIWDGCDPYDWLQARAKTVKGKHVRKLYEDYEESCFAKFRQPFPFDFFMESHSLLFPTDSSSCDEPSSSLLESP